MAYKRKTSDDADADVVKVLKVFESDHESDDESDDESSDSSSDDDPYGDAGDERSRFWTFTCKSRCEFDQPQSEKVPYDPADNEYRETVIGRLSFSRSVSSDDPKVVFCCWKLTNKTVDGILNMTSPSQRK